MNRAILMGAAALASAVAIHIASVAATPHIVMGIAMSRIAGEEGANVMKDGAPPTAEARTVVRPSPDLAYSACVLDLSQGPVHLTVRKSAPYTSLSLFAANTDNYFVEDDRVRQGPIEVIVVGPSDGVPAKLPQGARVVIAPEDHGMAIVRRVVAAETSLPDIEAARERSFCAPYRG